MSQVLRNPDFCLREHKGADQLRSNCEADQRYCFRYTDSTISVLLNAGISSFLPASATVQAGLCETWSETPKTGFLEAQLKSYVLHVIVDKTDMTVEPRHEKTGLRGFRPGPT